MLLYMALIAMSSADSETARNFETKQYAHNQGPATANTYDPDHHSLASGSVVWAHPVFRPLIPLVTPPVQLCQSWRSADLWWSASRLASRK